MIKLLHAQKASNNKIDEFSFITIISIIESRAYNRYKIICIKG